MSKDMIRNIPRWKNISQVAFGWVILLLVTFACMGEDNAPATKVKRIGIEEFEKLRTNTNAVVLDVRSAAEVKNGSIPGSVNIDINSSTFDEKVNALDKNKTYLVHCAVGMRSARACKKMENMGFKELYELAPGYDGWKKRKKQ